LSNERELVSQAIQNPSAFAEIYNHYLPLLYKYMRYRINSADEAVELTSRVFELVFANLKDYNPGQAPFAAWVFAIAHNTLVDYLRICRRRQNVSLELVGEVACSNTSPVETMIRNEDREKLVAALSSLNERERNLIGLKFGAGLTNIAISEITGLSRSNVAVVIYRAVKRLKAELANEG